MRGCQPAGGRGREACGDRTGLDRDTGLVPRLRLDMEPARDLGSALQVTGYISSIEHTVRDVLYMSLHLYCLVPGLLQVVTFSCVFQAAIHFKLLPGKNLLVRLLEGGLSEERLYSLEVSGSTMILTESFLRHSWLGAFRRQEERARGSLQVVVSHP